MEGVSSWAYHIQAIYSLRAPHPMVYKTVWATRKKQLLTDEIVVDENSMLAK